MFKGIASKEKVLFGDWFILLWSFKFLGLVAFFVVLGVGQFQVAYAQSSLNETLQKALNPEGQPNQNGAPGDSALPENGSDSAKNGEIPSSPMSPEQIAQQRKKQKEQAELERKKRQEEVRGRAFEAAVNGLLPLRPEEIREVLKLYDKTREAIETPYYPYPKPTVSVVSISLDPGSAPPELKLATGHVTTISLLDITGEPWPIEDISWAGDFQFTEARDGSHIIRITPLSEFAHGNLSMRLVGLKTPLSITLRTQREVAQYRVDLQIPGRGPNAKIPLVQKQPGLQVASDNASANSLLMAILDGAVPPSVEKLDVSGVDGRTSAYLSKGMIYLRTPLTLLSPGWQSSARSGDGTSVYILDDTPVVLLSESGQMKRAKLKKSKDDDVL